MRVEENTFLVAGGGSGLGAAFDCQIGHGQQDGPLLDQGFQDLRRMVHHSIISLPFLRTPTRMNAGRTIWKPRLTGCAVTLRPLVRHRLV